MAIHEYGQKTIFENFQTLNYGDRIWPDVENQNWQIVENKILAMNLENYLVARGNFTHEMLSPTILSVSLTPYSLNSSFEGAINGSYYKIPDTLLWSVEIPMDGTYYLYLTEITGAFDPTSGDSLDKESTTVQYTYSDLKKRILMAVITVLGGVITLNGDPEGQLRSQNFLSHILDSENPHGSTLTQTNIVSEDIDSSAANIDSLTSNSASITEIDTDVFKRRNIEQLYETVYDFTASSESNTEINLDTVLSLTSLTSTVVFVGYSVKTEIIKLGNTSEITTQDIINKINSILPIYIEYGVSGNNFFTIHNPNIISIEVKLLIKYSLSEVV